MSDEDTSSKFALEMPIKHYSPERQVLIANQTVELKKALHVAVVEYTKLVVARGDMLEPFAIGAAMYALARGIEEQFKDDPADLRAEQTYSGFFDMYSANSEQVKQLAANMKLLKMEPIGRA